MTASRARPRRLRPLSTDCSAAAAPHVRPQHRPAPGARVLRHQHLAPRLLGLLEQHLGRGQGRKRGGHDWSTLRPGSSPRATRAAQSLLAGLQTPQQLREGAQGLASMRLMARTPAALIGMALLLWGMSVRDARKRFTDRTGCREPAEVPPPASPPSALRLAPCIPAALYVHSVQPAVLHGRPAERSQRWRSITRQPRDAASTAALSSPLLAICSTMSAPPTNSPPT